MSGYWTEPRPSARWYAKKMARHGMALSSWFTGSLSARRFVGGPRVRALTYHRFGRDRYDPFCVTPEDFDAQMRTLAEQGRGVSLEQVRRFVLGEDELPDGACVVTIDDGCISTLTEALPVLRRWRVPAVAYVTSSLVGADLPALPERFMGWDELEELAASGLVEIGSHAHNHRSLGRLSPAEARDEAKRSRELLEDGLERPIHSFAYPFGTCGDFSPITERGLADAGYRIAFNSVHGTIAPGMDPISLPRVKVEGGEGLFMFRLLSGGAMDAWRAIDHGLWGVQRVRQGLG